MSPFDYVENSVRQIIVEIINEIIKNEKLPFERADSDVELNYSDDELKSKGLKRHPIFADIVLWKKGSVLQKGGAALVIELKQPVYNPLDEEIVEKTFVYAGKLGAPYFATSNMQNIVLFSSSEQAPLMDRRKGFYKISSIAHPNDVRREDVRKKMEDGLRNFLLKFTEIYSGKEVLPTIPVDEFFVYNLRTLVDSLSTPLTYAIIKAFKTDADFKKGFQNWFVEQGWTPPLNSNEEYYDDFNRSARQYLYLLANKLMFYLVLKTHVPDLPDLSVDETKDGESLKKALQQYFEKAKELSGDYETIFGINFIEKFPIPDEIVDPLKRFIENLSKYDLKRIGYADLGKIFDKLIPVEERHKLGQYFTSQKHADGTYGSDVVDLIIGFTVKSPDAIVLDGAVGAGTFLIKAYSRMKEYLNRNLSHEDIISRLFGVDIAKFPALLSMINLAIRDLRVKENYPNIINEDFFNVEPCENSNTIEKWVDKNLRLSLLAKKEKKICIPPVDAFVGNPPYTRQEEMEEYIEEYKNTLIEKIKSEWGFSLGKRSSIYVYFMLHGVKFLKEGGRIGYITSNSWLDVEYGKFLQEFLLKNTKIIALIESKVERWFEDADINTVITIAEKCNNENERNNNIVKFVQLKKRLEDIIPTTNENERWKAIDELIKLIENTNEYYENEKLRIYPKRQQELWNEGYNKEEETYAGSKWGKYLRAPNIYFKVLTSGKFSTLSEILSNFNGKLELGIATGANELLFISSELAKKMKLEEEFLSSAIESPHDCTNIFVKETNKKIIMIRKELIKKLENTQVGKYLKSLKEERENDFEVLKKPHWFIFKPITGNLAMPRILFERICIFYNPNKLLLSKQFVTCTLPDDDAKALSAILNSTLSWLIMEIEGRKALGLGSLNLELLDWKKLHVIDIGKLSQSNKQALLQKIESISMRPIGTVFEEIGANTPEEVSLDKVKPDRRELDKIVMGEILDLNEEEQLEVYRAVIDLVKSRIEKAKSVKRNEKKKGINLEQLAEDIIKESKLKPLPNFPDDYLNDLEIAEIKNVPSGREVSKEYTLEGIWLNIDGERIKCSSIEEANYLYWAALTGKTKVPIPSDTQKMTHITEIFTKEYNQRLKILEKWLKDNISNLKDREILREKIIEKLLRRK